MIYNLTTQKIISEHELLATSLAQQIRGLMFRKKHNLIMTFPKEQTISLHNFFVFYPLDILILNNKKQIIEIKHNFKPFTFYKAKHQGKYAIELAYPSTYQINDRLQF